MNTSKRSFLGAIGAFLTGVPFLPKTKKLKTSFVIQIEDLGDFKYRATLKTEGLFGSKIAEVISPTFTKPQLLGQGMSRFLLMWEIQRLIKNHAFPEETDVDYFEVIKQFPDYNCPNGPGTNGWQQYLKDVEDRINDRLTEKFRLKPRNPNA